MLSNNHKKQLLLKGVRGGFSFQFSLDAEDVYISSLSQDVNFGWEAPSGDDTSSKPFTQMAFKAQKTTSDMTLSGFIYVNSQLGTGFHKLTQLKNIANTGETWYLIDESGNKLKGSGEGIWYIKSIHQDSSDFVSGLDALKISFSINLSKYK